ncbi:hypothetical protein [Massilia rubra]|uniref:Uncharacterized protein n=1 Tax=Massilia rubra TaxID=2607910 RepID=A0ABX0M127_9BURK|nr:hypothetical protein [Massilia rubra]NHZ38011.1 hypothetical protein [Massilia rubra]
MESFHTVHTFVGRNAFTQLTGDQKVPFHNTRHFIQRVYGDRIVWTANHREVSAQDVEKVVEQYRHEGRLTIYSGTHGDPEGNFSGIDYAVRDFAIEDRETSNSNPRIRVVNVGRVKINIPDTIANATTDIMFAWCFSHASITHKSPYV